MNKCTGERSCFGILNLLFMKLNEFYSLNKKPIKGLIYSREDMIRIFKSSDNYSGSRETLVIPYRHLELFLLLPNVRRRIYNVWVMKNITLSDWLKNHLTGFFFYIIYNIFIQK